MLTKEQVERMRAMIARGDSPTHIARAVNCSRQRVYTEKRKMRKEGARETPKPAPLKIDVLGEFRERAARIEAEEAIKGIKESAADLLQGPTCEPGERDHVRAAIRECDEALKLATSLPGSEAARLLAEVRNRFTKVTGRLDARRELEHRLASTRGALGAAVAQYNEASWKRADEETRFEWLSGINGRAYKEGHERARRIEALFKEEGEILKRIGVVKDIEGLLATRADLQAEVGELRDVQARQAELAKLRAEVAETRKYRDILSKGILDRQNVLEVCRLAEVAVLLEAFETMPADQLKTIRVALDVVEGRFKELVVQVPLV